MWRKTDSICAIVFLLFIDASLSLNRGSTCETPNGECAICTSIYECKPLREVLTTEDPSQKEFLQKSQCGYDSVALVCCGEDTNYKQSYRSDRTNLQYLPDRNSCGFQGTYKILSGKDTSLEEFPWMALFLWKNNNNQITVHCGGTLISQRYILTAAHCFKQFSKDSLKSLIVRLGDYNIDKSIDCTDDTNRYCAPPTIDMAIEEVKIHDGFDKNMHNDIALIRLNEDVRSTSFIHPICLPEPLERANVGDYLTAAGWGTTELLSYSPVKLKVELPIVDEHQCRAKLLTRGIQLIESQICAGGQDGKDTCRGDSGGPLMNTAKNDSNQWYLEGIVSLGQVGCGCAGWPGIYTKVEKYLQWIYDNVRK